MQLDRASCERARRARDPRFDGRFFTAVRTTRIYCRPICPAPSPKESNITYYPTAAACAEAGYRPCLRCRPETSPGTPAWAGTPATVSRGLRLIGENALDTGDVESLAAQLGIGSRHLRRLFLEHLGATPIAVAQTRRLHFAKRLIDDTDLPFTEIAMAAGFGSVRRFNAVFLNLYGRTPTELRKSRARSKPAGRGYFFRIPVRPPFDWPALLAFLRARAIPGVEIVSEDSYRRTVEHDGKTGEIEIHANAHALDVRVDFPDARALLAIMEKVRRLFDVAADPAAIADALSRDATLAPRAAAHPGLRVPGAWDGFELAVRAILGQQVSVAGASTLAGRIVREFGERTGDLYLFPTRSRLAYAPLEQCGLTRARAATIRSLAQSNLAFSGIGETESFLDAFRALPGIGEWTAQYVAMRALSEPDAFPAGDLVLQRAADAKSARELDRMAESWRPWRAYAAMYLWQGVKDDKSIHRNPEPRRQAAAVGR